MTVWLPRRVAPGSTATYPIGPLNAVTLSDAVDEFRGRYGGEWRVTPRERQSTTQTVNIGSDLVGSAMFQSVPYPAIGTMSSTNGRWGGDLSASVVFEYGSRHANVSSYTFNVDRQQTANRVYVPRVGFPEPGRVGTTPYIMVESATVKTAMSAMYDAWVDPGEIELAANRQQLADFHLNIRQGPRRIVSFTPAVNNIHEPWEDYDVGDFVRFRALDGDTLRLDMVVRIYGITVNIDNQGNESVTLTTQEEATS